MNDERTTMLEHIIRAELRELRGRLKQGKGKWGTSRYVNDSVWGAWVHAERILSDVLAKAGLEDGEE